LIADYFGPIIGWITWAILLIPKAILLLVSSVLGLLWYLVKSIV
jgi:hypothetical protein